LASSFGTPAALAVGGGASALVAVGATLWVMRSAHSPRSGHREAAHLP
jgi:hypothetical protein